MDYSQFLSMSHEISLVSLLIILLLADLVMGKKKSGFQACAIGLFAIHTVLGFTCFGESAGNAFADMYQSSDLHVLIKNILNIGTCIVLLMSYAWNEKENKEYVGEFYFLTLSTLLGMYFMISSGDFLFFYIGLELASIPMAALVAFDKKSKESAEAAAKYILTAAFSSGVMLFGISLIYGTCGSLYFDEVAYKFASATPLMVLAFVCFIAGLGFKISLVPFHFWTADTYQGAPTSITAYLSVISKGAAVFTCMAILFKAFPSSSEVWQTVLWIIIVLTIVVGNLFAMRQENIKRFFAYSSVSQAGYIMLGVIAGNEVGVSTTIFYILIYMFTNLAAFGVISIIERQAGKLNISDYNGLYSTNPKLAVMMMLALFSLGGIPPFAGMFSKFFIFVGLFKSGMIGLLFIALINTVVSLYYYLLIVKAMFIKENEKPIAKIESDKTTICAVVICTIAVIAIGFISPIYHYIESVSSALN